ncbi:MAG: hypothetical protein KAS97_04285, partial [Candidatus Aminicenantes bacterium]|nr:hypothetical protein [Candidatus Aminicenantes bacterium]
MKRILVLLITLLIVVISVHGDDFTEKANGFAAEFDDLKAKVTTLDQFSPESFPGFEDLEKTNQLVEQLDFNNRKFKLLLAQYNLVTDKIFPLCREFSSSSDKNVILQKLGRFTGSGEDSLKRIQRGLNHVLLKISRIEKEIEMVQLNKKNKEITKREERVGISSDDKLPLDERINLLSTELEEIGSELTVQLAKSENLKKEEKRRSDKIEE